jgi:hypothetical protein
MTASAGTAGAPIADSLPRRDLLLLPLIAAATILVIGIGSEIVARLAFPDSKESLLDCLVLNDPSTGVHGMPNTVCRGKVLEGPMVEYRYNSCGHRAGMECAPAPPDVLRVVLVGSSAAEGYGVSREQSFAAMLPALLSQRTGRAVQVYDAGIEFGTPLALDLQFQHTLALKPDIVLWTMSTWEFSNVDLTTFERGHEPPGDLPSLIAAAQSTFRKQGFAAALGVAIADSIELVVRSRSVFMIRHLIYLSESQYERNARMKPAEVDFLRVHPDQASLRQLQQFTQYTAEIQAKANAAHLPFVVTMWPLRLQASMISRHEGPPEFDPYWAARFTRSVVEANGGVFVDILPAFAHLSSPGQYYYAVDGHLNARGHALFAHILADALTTGAVPGLAARRDLAQSTQAQTSAARTQP